MPEQANGTNGLHLPLPRDAGIIRHAGNCACDNAVAATDGPIPPVAGR